MNLETMIGVDLGGTSVRAGRVSRTGEVLDVASRSTPRNFADMRAAIREILAELGPAGKGDEPEAVGIGCRGVLHTPSTVVSKSPGDLVYLEGKALRELVGADADRPVFADNDARVTLLGEVLWGAAAGRRNVVLLTLGTGVGGGVLSDGHVSRGHAGAAGHLGHVSVDPSGPLCICGNVGCLETRFSARAIEAAYFTYLHRKVATTSAVPDSSVRVPSTQEIFSAASAGDEIATVVVESALAHLEAAIVSFANSFDPEIVLLAGQIALSASQWLPGLQERVQRRTRFLVGRDIPLVVVPDVALSGVRGAAALAFWELGERDSRKGQ